jgi:hypothetical protein
MEYSIDTGFGSDDTRPNPGMTLTLRSNGRNGRLRKVQAGGPNDGAPVDERIPTRLDGTGLGVPSPDPGSIPVTPIYLRSGNGSGPKYYFRDTGGLDEAIEDLIRRFPQFRNKSTMLRSLVHFGLNVLSEFGNAGLPPEALEQALLQEVGYIQSLTRIDAMFTDYSAQVGILRTMGDYRLSQRHLNQIIQLLNQSSLTTTLYAHYLEKLNANPDVTKLVEELEERGFDMSFWNTGGNTGDRGR